MKKITTSVLIIVIGLYFMVNIGKRVFDLYKTNDRLTISEQKIQAAKDSNDALKKELAFRNTDFYIEQQAREKLNLAKPGERVAVIPGLEETEKPTPLVSKQLPNWKQWYDLFFEE